ncbi:MAG: hypothetical protein KGJ57_23350 [Sphingomonadales bacterium]|nr:hypothetical protein [Sphingomonadales bacterium]
MHVDAAPGIGWGVLRRNLSSGKNAGVENNLVEFAWLKAHPVAAARPAHHGHAWQPTATVDVLLPEGAPSELLDVRRLAERYEADAFVGIKDLAVLATFKIDKPGQILNMWADVRAFARFFFCEERNMAVAAFLHVPSRSGVKRAAHIHLVAPARELDCEGFGAFCRPFVSDAGASVMVKAWSVWKRPA